MLIRLRNPQANYLLARARAERVLRLANLRGSRISWDEGAYFYDGPSYWDCLGETRIGRNFGLRGGPSPSRVSVEEGARLTIGNDSGFNYGLELHASVEVEIGDRVMGGSRVTIYDTNFHAVEEGGETRSGPIRIGYNAWLAQGATILPGVTIGEHAVIAANAVITRDVPPRTLMVGNPAKPVRELKASERWHRWDT